MLLISYDISDDHKRAKFSRFLSKFGHRIQYSIFQIDNGTHMLNNIVTEIKNKYEKLFDESDSIYIFNIKEDQIIQSFGYAKHDTENFIYIK